MNLPVLSSDRLVTLRPSGAALSHGKLKNNNCNILYLNTRHFIILYNRQLVLSVFHFRLIYILVWLPVCMRTMLYFVLGSPSTAAVYRRVNVRRQTSSALYRLARSH